MMENIFTSEERSALFRCLCLIWRDEHLRPDGETARKLSLFLRHTVEENGVLRNVFGHNRIVMSLQSVLLAVHETGLRGKVLTAFLLHSVVMTEEQCDRAGELFGKDIEEVLRSFRRIEKLEVRTEAMKTDNFRNLLISQACDMRIILLLIAHCVNMMRNVKDTAFVEEQSKLATEAAYLYAPLAHKLGLYRLKSELEDLSLKYLEHDAYYMIKESLNATKRSRDAYIERFIAPIRKMLDAEGLRYHMKGRTKSIHSIWQKMKKQQCGFDGVYDLFAIRIILDAPLQKEKEQCWKVFSLITDQYESDLKRLRDWLTVPKSNGYESLHITVKGPEDKWVEVQIRTERMDDVAERGLAAHWRYKGVKSSGGVDEWLTNIRNALETGNEKLLSDSLGAARAKEIYVFTPKGDLYQLPVGATILDFAYRIHSAVGNRCVGGKINGRNVPIRQVLESGETVEIVTSASQYPKAEWLNIVVSSHARSKIRTAVKEFQAKDGSLARELLERKLKNRKIEWEESVINQLVKKSGYKEAGEFYRAIADGRLDVNETIELYVELSRKEAGLQERAAIRSAGEYNFEKELEKRSQGESDVVVIGRDLKGLDFQMARCCNPVYGDDVFGFVTVHGGIKIHRENCPNAPALKQRFGYRIVKARWAGKGGGKYPITLHIVGNDDLGVVNNITSVISKEERIMLRSINIDSNDGLFFGILTVMVDDTQVLNALIKKLRGVKGVKAVSR